MEQTKEKKKTNETPNNFSYIKLNTYYKTEWFLNKITVKIWPEDQSLGRKGHIDVQLSVTLQDRFAEVKVRFWGCSQPINMSLGSMLRCDMAVTLQLNSCTDHIDAGSILMLSVDRYHGMVCPSHNMITFKHVFKSLPFWQGKTIVVFQ